MSARVNPPLKSPIDKIPNEVLSQIFVRTQNAYHDRAEALQAPITVSHISSRWRSLALSMGELWTTIIITFPTSHSQQSRTLTWLSRSSPFPIDVFLDLRDPSWDWNESTHAFTWQDMESLLRLLVTHISRWRELEILTDTWAPIFTFLWHTQGVDTPTPLNLERLLLSRCNAYFALPGQTFEPVSLRKSLPLFGGHAVERLRDVSLAGVHVDWSASSALRNLVHLELKYHASDVIPSSSDFQNMLIASPLLQTLAIFGSNPAFPPSSAGASSNFQNPPKLIELHHLVRFSIGFVDIAHSLRLFPLFYLPSLEELGVEDISASLDQSAQQDASPLLDWLTTTYTTRCPSHSHTAACCGTNSFPLGRLTLLELHNLESSSASYSQFFAQLVSLTKLVMYDANKDALQQLAPTMPDGTTLRQPLPCPKLSRLECRGMDVRAVAEAVTLRSRVPGLPDLAVAWQTDEDDIFNTPTRTPLSLD